MKILAIETSCDETSAAIVENGVKILSNVVASSLALHSKTGGIIPEVAAREQIRYIIPVIQEALDQAGFSKSVKQLNSKTVKQLNSKTVKQNTEAADYRSTDSPFHRFTDYIDAIAVTVGPGLIGSLLVGVETARTLAYLTAKPIIPINHLVGHIYANWLDTSRTVKQLNSRTVKQLNSRTVKQNTEAADDQSSDSPFSRFTEPIFPAIALVVSGGHTDLVLMKSHRNIQWVGGTRDDAAGECFDKTARLLGLGYPGGPAIAAEAAKLPIINYQLPITLPRPMINEDNFDFSFSGLKTAVIREVNNLKNNQQFSHEAIQQLSFEIQEAITDVLVEKTIRAAQKYKVKSILLSGGVAANQRLREKFSLALSSQNFTGSFFVPQPKLCTDNAAFIASGAFFHYQPTPWSAIKVNPDLTLEHF